MDESSPEPEPSASPTVSQPVVPNESSVPVIRRLPTHPASAPTLPLPPAVPRPVRRPPPAPVRRATTYPPPAGRRPTTVSAPIAEASPDSSSAATSPYSPVALFLIGCLSITAISGLLVLLVLWLMGW